MKKHLFKIYHIIKSIIAPELRYSQSIYEDTLRMYAKPHYRWLDIGCGHNLLPEWRLQAERELVDNCSFLVGLDYSLHSLKNHKTISKRVSGDATNLPFIDSTFDFVSANMVVEHFNDPETQFKEIARVLRPGGIFIFHTPNIFGYVTMFGRLIPDSLKNRLIFALEGRKDEDIFKTYYKANSEKSIIRLARQTGFTIKAIKIIASSAEFAIFSPFALMELIWIRVLMTRPFRPLRTNIIAILQKSNRT